MKKTSQGNYWSGNGDDVIDEDENDENDEDEDDEDEGEENFSGELLERQRR